MNRRYRPQLVVLTCLLLVGCFNPFAPGFDESGSPTPSILADQTTIEGVFQNFRHSYAFKDTTIYSRLLAANFVFVWRDFERGLDVSWGRDEEMRTTHGLFLNVQNLNLVWNNVISFAGDSLKSSVTRGFNLTITFNPNFIERIDGYANLTLERRGIGDIWKITRWRDESNF